MPADRRPMWRDAASLPHRSPAGVGWRTTQEERGMANKKPGGSSALADIEKHAAKIRSELKFPKQNEVFRAAVEAGYLTAAADGVVDADERAAMIRAVDLISHGVVIEW